MGLTVKKIEAATRARNGDRMVDGNNLYLRLGSKDAKTFQVRTEVDGKRAWISLGRFPKLSLADARTLAGVVRSAISQGTPLSRVNAVLKLSCDPLKVPDLLTDPANAPAAAPDTAVVVPSFAEMATRWYRQKRGSWSNGKHVQQNWNTLETYILPEFGALPVTEVRRKHIITALRKIWVEKHETAQRTLGRVRAIMELALLEEIIDVNPAQFDAGVAFGDPRIAKGHHGFLDPSRMHEAWCWLQDVSCDEDVRQAAMLTILSAKRTKEIRFLHSDHLDLETAIWTTEAGLMKSRRPHRIPITREMAVIFDNMAMLGRDCGYFFARPTKSGVISENTLLALFKKFDPAITTHGFRASFKTWSAETDKSHTATEFALDHRQQGLEAAYQRSDMLEARRVLMAEWAAHVTAGMAPRVLRDL
ncbi:hypothetical protein DKT77_17890 [Meridianimarinicoccus roseus]|uniref:Uncharacterized protein n=1 Tax=Meridianimarinicoccus roseus TaxID=2072018 RepID=A0A2V2LD93_9RHOB|nr:site-specific integrase [Meridianimarinicoccus roseus]PWR01266.1 hypothetical protein DKT77_17890 [Meridianimarinicoccus roseus]